MTKKTKTLLIGNFDGVHTGHQSLITFAKKVASNSSTELLVITFNPHPREIILGKKIDLILPYSEKIKLLKDYSINNIEEINFNKDISTMSPEDFIEKFLEDKGTLNIVVGSDFKFGFNASGNIDTLKYYKNSKFNVFPVDLEFLEDERISSTAIKNFLRDGFVRKANKFLGRKYYIKGFVVEGQKRGRQIGFPTTNLKTDWGFLPKNGVYVTNIIHNQKKYEGITNIGYRPTFADKGLLIESHFFDFNEYIYNEHIKIEFIERIRSEKKFDTVEELIENIKKDVEFAKRTFIEEGSK